jgi:multicomponent Na+:H+ antiporter subunit B
MTERNSLYAITSLLFAGGLAFLLLAITITFNFGAAPMVIGKEILKQAATQTGSANIVTSVVLAYRGIDTLGEIAILFAAASGVGLVLGKRSNKAKRDAKGGFILVQSAEMLFPLLLMVGFYIILHGHLTPGGGFQGGVILAAAFFLPILARPGSSVNHTGLSIIEGFSGAAFIVIGLLALVQGQSFLQPLLDKGQLGDLFSAGTLPLLYLAVGLKVGAELSGLLANIADVDSGGKTL